MEAKIARRVASMGKRRGCSEGGYPPQNSEGGPPPASFGIFEKFFAQNVFKCLKRAKGVKIFPYKRLKKIQRNEFSKKILSRSPPPWGIPPAQ